jgi:hypothetical protein
MKMGTIRKHILSAGILSALMLLAIGSVDTDEDTKRIQGQAPDYRTTADALFSEFKENEVAADAKYKGKIVVVSGVIQAIGKDVMDQAYIVLGGGGFLDGVQCTFTESQNASVGSLTKGESVSVKGEISGKMGNVLITKCSLQ